VKRREKTFILFHLKAKKMYISLRFKAKRKNWKRNKAKIRCTNFALVRSEKFKEKRRGTILFFHVSV
jgi:hypothetical protein